MTGNTSTDDRFELTVGEAAIHSVVKQAGGNNVVSSLIPVIKEMLADPDLYGPTEDQLGIEGAVREMSELARDRLKRAEEHLKNGTSYRDVGFEVMPHDGAYDGPNPGVKTVEELGGSDAEVVSSVMVVDHNGEMTTQEGTYPLVKVGEHCVCTCEERHSPRHHGPCRHELAHDIRVAQNENQGSEVNADEITVCL